MSGMDFNYVRLPGAEATPEETGPLTRHAVDAIESAHVGVWISAELEPGRTRVYTSTSERGEAGLSVVFDVHPSVEQARVAADGLLALRQRLEEIERRR